MLRALLVFVLCTVAHAALAQAPDPAAGRALAERWCVSCHVIGPTQARGTDTGPAFTEIAMNPMWWDETRFAEYLARPHPVMPNFSVTRREVVDLMAFIRAQRR